MDQQLLCQAVEVAEQIIKNFYFHRDIDAVLDRMAPDATWIGPGGQEKKYTLAEMRTYLELGRDSIPSCELSDPDWRAIGIDENYCLVTGSMTVRTVPGSKLLLEVDQRFSFLLRYRNERFEVVHLHNSNPYGEMGADEYFPHRIGSQSYQYLQRLLNEKTEVLDMITQNINGGLKGSNDDSTFSYFYVNEGLPQMLGYTHSEFMEKTGGGAVGAVYPPDLPGALIDCTRCFAQGQDYASEYRMEKKDGSLMWVLDSGRKVVDSEGISRINSIITDITPLKQALFDLEVERERYRIALEHITGAMCEYDVAQDLFTMYRQLEQEGKLSIQQSEIAQFSQKICSSALASPEDGAAFLSLCTGKTTGTIEFHTRLLNQGDVWHWAQFSCSVVTDHAGVPVRAIGMLQDVTAEKERNLELVKQAQRDGLTGLFNQTTMKAIVRACLEQQSGTAPRKYALLMLDLDRFKEVNDLHGHAHGDMVLTQTGRILEEVAGVDSIVGRIGGDEFLILTKNKEPADVEQIADEILQRVRKIGIDKEFPVTCSIGIAFQSQLEEPFTHWFERVDKALYLAKNNGRDRACVDV